MRNRECLWNVVRVKALSKPYKPRQLGLRVPPAEQVILLASGAVRAPHATYEQDRYTHRHKNRQQGAVRCYPVNKAVHFTHHFRFRHARH